MPDTLIINYVCRLQIRCSQNTQSRHCDLGLTKTAILAFASESRMPKCLTVNMQKLALCKNQPFDPCSRFICTLMTSSSANTPALSWQACTVYIDSSGTVYIESSCTVYVESSCTVYVESSDQDMLWSLPTSMQHWQCRCECASMLTAWCHSPEGGTAIRSATTPLCIPPLIPAAAACMHVRATLAYCCCSIMSQLMLLHETCTYQWKHNCCTVTTIQHHAHWHLDDAAGGVLNEYAGQPKTWRTLIAQQLTLSVRDTHMMLICRYNDAVWEQI